MKLKIITPPTELITVNDFAAFARIDFPSSETTVIQSMIKAARLWCEEYLRRAIGVQVLELALDGFPTSYNGAILLRPPVSDLVSVKYDDTGGTVQTLEEDTDYLFTGDGEPAQVRPIGVWPVARNSQGSVRVRFETGYDNDQSPQVNELLPESIRLGILMQAANLYQNREAQTEKILTANPTLERLLSTYRLEMGI